MSSKKQRWAERVPFAAEVRFSADGEDLQGRISNLSRNGIFVEHSSAPPVGSRVRVTFEVDGHEIRAEGAVADHRTERGFGVRLELSEDSRAVVAKFVARLVVAQILTSSE